MSRLLPLLPLLPFTLLLAACGETEHNATTWQDVAQTAVIFIGLGLICWGSNRRRGG